MTTIELKALTHEEMMLTEGGIMIALCIIMFALGMATTMCML
jgi:hypothetical protein